MELVPSSCFLGLILPEFIQVIRKLSKKMKSIYRTREKGSLTSITYFPLKGEETLRNDEVSL